MQINLYKLNELVPLDIKNVPGESINSFPTHNPVKIIYPNNPTATTFPFWWNRFSDPTNKSMSSNQIVSVN